MVETTGNFVSPFTAADFVQQLEDTATDGIPFVMPDTSLFDDSLGDDFHHKAKLSESVKPAQNLDDSLCDEETQLPSVEPEPADIGKLGTVIAEYKGSGRNLDDSLCCDMDEETLDNANEGGPLSGQISQTAQDVPVPCLDDNIDMGSSSPSLSIPEAISRDSTGKPMSPHESKSEENSQDSQPAATSKMVPSFGKKKKGFVPPAAKAPGPGNSTVTKPTCKNALKTKKSKCKTAKLEETTAGDCQEQKLCFDADKENGSGTPKPKSSPSKADTSVTANSKKKSAAAAPVANSTAGKGAMQQVAHEKKNRDSKKQEKEKMKLEREQKRQERETKKLEQEQKRAEKERLKEEKRLEQERKKVEREQKKLDKELKKLEQEQKKAQKQTTSGCGSLVQKKKSSNSEPPVQHNMSSEEGTGKSPENTVCDTTKEGSANSDFRVTSITKLSTSPPETTSPDAHSNPPGCNSAAPEGTATSGSEASSLEGAESNRDRKRMQVGETTLSSSSDEASTEHTISSAVSNCKQPDVSLVTSNSGQTGASKKPSSHPLTKVHVTSKDGKKVPKKAAVKKANLQLKESVDKKDQVKMKQASSSAMQHEKCHSDSPGQGSKNKSHIENKLTSIPRISAGSRKRKAVGADSITSCSESECEPPRPKKPRSKPSNYYGPVWVQCDRADCQKWRQLKDCRDPSEVPEKWICSMNTEPAYNSCSAAEEQWSEPGESQEFVESPFIPGSLVWAKMEGYPWWPAMVEEDPDEETYYEMGGQDSNDVPVRYHVVFFDTPVCRAWVFAPSVQAFSEDSDANEAGSVSVAQKHRRALKMGIKQAKKASKMTIAERLSQLTFVKRFHSRKRRHSFADPVNSNTQHSNNSKSARPSTSKLIRRNSQKQVTSADETMSLSMAVESVPSIANKERGKKFSYSAPRPMV